MKDFLTRSALMFFVAVMLMTLISCTKRYTKYVKGADGHSCEVTQLQDGALIECYNGNTAFVPNGERGDSSVLRLVDPCDDGPGPDEVLVVMDDGRVLAWYQNLGLTLLDPNSVYVTTDSQQCRFQVDVQGNVTEL